MKKYFHILMIAVVAFLICSCSSKESAYKDLEKLTEQIEENGDDYKLSDWTKAEKKLNDIVKILDKYQDEYDEDEQEEITEMVMKCSSYIAVGQAKTGMSAVNDVLNGLGVDADDIFGSSDDEEDDD